VSPTSGNQGFGDDPTFINGIASVVRNNPVAYQSYFYNHDYATQLALGPLSRGAYMAHFGSNGDSVGSPVKVPPDGRRSSSATSIPRRRDAPAIAIVGGPAAGAVVRSHVVFSFTVRGAVQWLRCSLDGRSRHCSGARRDVMNLTSGRHVWSVTARMHGGRSKRQTRCFVVRGPGRGSLSALRYAAGGRPLRLVLRCMRHYGAVASAAGLRRMVNAGRTMAVSSAPASSTRTTNP